MPTKFDWDVVYSFALLRSIGKAAMDGSTTWLAYAVSAFSTTDHQLCSAAAGVGGGEIWQVPASITTGKDVYVCVSVCWRVETYLYALITGSEYSDSRGW